MSKRFPLVFGSGPWVSRLGPHLPATPADVVLYVAGKVAEVEEIDPFAGAVRPKVPVPPGTVVEIDALSISHAVLPMRVGLPGARIGQVGMPIGPPGSRGRMTLVLGSPRPNPQPLRVAHRYLAQDRARASLVGDPIGMRVGRRLGYAPPTPLSGRFVRVRVSLDPSAFASLWEVRGTGEVTPTQDGVVTAAGAGPVFATTPLPTRDAGRSFLTGRVVVDPPISSDFAPRAAIGLHDGGAAIVTAIIDAAGFRHTGLLVGEGEWGDPAAWKLFPELELRAESPTTLRVLSQQGLTRGLRAGDRLRVPGGPQAGTLVVAHVRRNDLSQVLLDLQTPLPIDPDSEGARVVTGVLDLGVTASTWVLRVDSQDGVVIASAASAEAALVQVSGTVAPPLRAPLLLRGVSDPQTQGAGLFGSVVGGASWQAVVGEAYGARQPDRALRVESSIPTVLPSADWVEVPPAEIVPAAGQVVVRGSGGGHPAGVALLSPLMSQGSVVQAAATVAVRDETGTGDLWIDVCDGNRRVVLASLITVTDGDEERVWMPDGAGLSSGADPALSGWVTTGGQWIASPVALRADGNPSSEISLPTAFLLRLSSRVDASAGQVRLVLGDAGHGVQVTVRRGLVEVRAGATFTKSFPVLAGPLRVEVGISPAGGIVAVEGAPPVALSPVDLAGPVRRSPGATVSGTSGARLYRAAVFLPPPAGARRTIGLLLDPSRPDDLASWRLPYKDVDPRVFTDLRVLLDPAWGAVVQAPGAPLPPGWLSDRIDDALVVARVGYEEAPSSDGFAQGVLLGVGPFALGVVEYQNARVRVAARDAPGEVGPQRAAVLGRSAMTSSGDHLSDALPARFRVPVRRGVASMDAAGVRLSRLFRARRAGTVAWWEPPAVVLLDDGSVQLPMVFSGHAEVEGVPSRMTHPETLESMGVAGSPHEHGEGTPPFYPLWMSQPLRRDLPDPDSTGKSAGYDPLDVDRSLLLVAERRVEDGGARQRVWVASDDPDDGPSTSGGDPGDDGGGGPVFEIDGYEETFPRPRDGTNVGAMRVAGLFLPRGGKHPGTPTLDRRGRGPAYVVAPATWLVSIELLP